LETKRPRVSGEILRANEKVIRGGKVMKSGKKDEWRHFQIVILGQASIVFFPSGPSREVMVG
jgi:hypothetical protein